jgi:hydrogenase expression/formation protein HypC
MCLAIPGQLIEITGEGISRTGRVSFGGIVKQISLAYTPEAIIGDYVLAHVGFALQIVDEEEARRVFAYLEELGELDEIRGN